MPTSIPLQPTITSAGLAAIFNAQSTGVEFALSHVAFGTAQYVPDGSETGLRAEKVRVPIAGGGRISPTQIQIYAVALAAAGAPFFAGEVGFFGDDGATLLAVYSSTATPNLFLSDTVSTSVSYALGLAALPANSVTVTIDPSASAALLIIGQHVASADPHPQYVQKVNGIAAYDATVTFKIDALIIGDDGQVYQSIQASNIGHTPSTSPTWWTPLANTAYAIDSNAGVNNINIALKPSITKYYDGMVIRFEATGAANTGAVVMNAGGASIPLNGAAGPLQGGEIVAGKKYLAIYDDTSNTFILVGQGGGALQTAAATASNHAIQKGQADAAYAPVAGNASQTFAVANAAASNQAVPKGQADSTYAALHGSASNTFAVANATASNQAVAKGQADSTYAPVAGNASQKFDVATATAATNAVQLAQMQAAQSGYAGEIAPAAGTTLDTTFLGQFVLVGGGNSYTLDALSTFPIGSGIVCSNSSAAQTSLVAPTGTDTISLGSAITVNPFVIQPGQTVKFIKASSTSWHVDGVSINAVLPLVVAAATAGTHAAQLQQVQQGQGGFSGAVSLQSANPVTNAFLGQLCHVGSGNTYNLDAIANFAVGNSLNFIQNGNAGNATIAPNGTDIIVVGGTQVPNIAVPPGQLLRLTKISSTSWRADGLPTAEILALPVATATIAAHAVPLAQMWAAQGGYANALTIGASTLMTNAYLGYILGTPASGSPYTLDLAANFVKGQSLNLVCNSASGTATIQTSGSDEIFIGSTQVSSFLLSAGQTAKLIQVDSTHWRLDSIATSAVLPLPVANATASNHAINKGQADAAYAPIAGSASQTFAVANATASNQAVAKGQADSTYAPTAGSASQTFTVANATASNQAVAKGQADSTYAPVAGNASQTFAVANAAASNQAVAKGQADAAYAPIAGNSSQAFAVSAAASATQAVNLGQFGSTLNAAGYQKFPGGLIMQWGPTGSSGSSAVNVVFPIVFPNGLFTVSIGSVAASGAGVFATQDGAATATGFPYSTWNAGGTRATGLGASFIAFGH